MTLLKKHQIKTHIEWRIDINDIRNATGIDDMGLLVKIREEMVRQMSALNREMATLFTENTRSLISCERDTIANYGLLMCSKLDEKKQDTVSVEALKEYFKSVARGEHRSYRSHNQLVQMLETLGQRIRKGQYWNTVTEYRDFPEVEDV